MLEQLRDLIIANGGEMLFEDFVEAATVARLKPRQWLNAKHAGFVTTEVAADGKHYIRAVVAQPAPQEA